MIRTFVIHIYNRGQGTIVVVSLYILGHYHDIHNIYVKLYIFMTIKDKQIYTFKTCKTEKKERKSLLISVLNNNK